MLFNKLTYNNFLYLPEIFTKWSRLCLTYDSVVPFYLDKGTFIKHITIKIKYTHDKRIISIS